MKGQNQRVKSQSIDSQSIYLYTAGLTPGYKLTYVYPQVLSPSLSLYIYIYWFQKLYMQN